MSCIYSPSIEKEQKSNLVEIYSSLSYKGYLLAFLFLWLIAILGTIAISTKFRRG